MPSDTGAGPIARPHRYPGSRGSAARPGPFQPVGRDGVSSPFVIP